MLFERAITPRDINYQQLHLTVSTRMGEHHLDWNGDNIYSRYIFFQSRMYRWIFLISNWIDASLGPSFSQFIVATGILFSKFSSFCGTCSDK